MSKAKVKTKATTKKKTTTAKAKTPDTTARIRTLIDATVANIKELQDLVGGKEIVFSESTDDEITFYHDPDSFGQLEVDFHLTSYKVPPKLVKSDPHTIVL